MLELTSESLAEVLRSHKAGTPAAIIARDHGVAVGEVEEYLGAPLHLLPQAQPNRRMAEFAGAVLDRIAAAIEDDERLEQAAKRIGVPIEELLSRRPE